MPDWAAAGIEEEDLFDIPDDIEDRVRTVWRGGIRDTAFRNDGDSLIVVAGGMSWGDDPDGYGYQALRDAHRIGLLGIMGIN